MEVQVELVHAGVRMLVCGVGGDAADADLNILAVLSAQA